MLYLIWGSPAWVSGFKRVSCRRSVVVSQFLFQRATFLYFLVLSGPILWSMRGRSSATQGHNRPAMQWVPVDVTVKTSHVVCPPGPLCSRSITVDERVGGVAVCGIGVMFILLSCFLFGGWMVVVRRRQVGALFQGSINAYNALMLQ